MGRTMPFGSVPEGFEALAPGITHFKLELTETHSKANEERGKAAKLMYKLAATVIAPDAEKGRLYFENFVVGTETDPDAEDLATWQNSLGFKTLKKLAKEAGVPIGNEADSDEFCAAITGQEVLGDLETNINQQPGPYKGRVENRIKGVAESSGWFAVGERPIKTITTQRVTNGSGATPSTADKLACQECGETLPRPELAAHMKAHLEAMEATE